MNYTKFYEWITYPFRRWPKGIVILRGLNRFLTLFMAIIYFIFIIYLLLTSRDIFFPLPFIIIPAVSFVLMSLIRHWINAPRPFEEWEITPLISREALGESMPSKHVFSATIISMSILYVFPTIGKILLGLTVLLAFCRVLGGVHYPKDVIVGFLTGIIISALYHVVFFF